MTPDILLKQAGPVCINNRFQSCLVILSCVSWLEYYPGSGNFRQFRQLSGIYGRLPLFSACQKFPDPGYVWKQKLCFWSKKISCFLIRRLQAQLESPVMITQDTNVFSWCCFCFCFSCWFFLPEQLLVCLWITSYLLHDWCDQPMLSPTVSQ